MIYRKFSARSGRSNPLRGSGLRRGWSTRVKLGSERCCFYRHGALHERCRSRKLCGGGENLIGAVYPGRSAKAVCALDEKQNSVAGLEVRFDKRPEHGIFPEVVIHAEKRWEKVG